MLNVTHIAHCVFDDNHPDRQRLSVHPGRWVLNLAMAQNAGGKIHAEIVTPVYKASRHHVAEIDGVKVHYLAIPPFRVGSLTRFWYEKHKISRYINSLRPDIVHAHGTEGINALAAQTTRRPFVITAQGMMFMIVPVLNPPRNSAYWKLLRLEKHTLTKANHIIAKSDNVAEALKSQFPHLSLHKIPNTFDPRLLDIQEQREADTIVFVGTVDERKGFHLFNDALPLVKDSFPTLQLRVVGDRGITAQGYEQQQIKRLRALLGSGLTTFGRIPGMVVGQIVARSTALVAPSLEEMFGNQLIEALLVGTHGIVTENTGLAENARRFGNATVVPQQDPQALAKAIIETLRRKEFFERKQARQRIIEYMGPETVAKAHYDLYQSILQEHFERRIQE